MPNDLLVSALLAGWSAFLDYISAHVLFSIVPAFFLAGAIASLLKKEAVMKYLGAEAKRSISYVVAAVAGIVLAVCSCTILPLFTGIYRRGAGLGPAITFLYSGPAISIMAITITANILGYDIGVARAVAAMSSAILVGLIMGSIFKSNIKTKQTTTKIQAGSTEGASGSIRLIFIALLTAMVLIGPASYVDIMIRVGILIGLTILAAYVLFSRFAREEIREFGNETWFLFKKIFPILLLGSFASGVIGALIPVEVLKLLFGTNSVLSCLIASIAGAFLYMPTLLEVPIVGNLFGYSAGIMASGPALAILLTGPTLSLPSMIVIWRTIGGKKAGTYFVLVIALATAASLAFGMLLG
ncbi:MAG TPA: permease [Candidatus Methanomethylicus sp.]|nr:permease [Candidatus Methanomethylicus sp.]